MTTHCLPNASSNISDGTTIANAIEQIKVLGINGAKLITDNGCCSSSNIARLLLAGFRFITRIKTSENWVRQAIDENLDLADDPARAVPFDPAVCTRECGNSRSPVSTAAKRRT